LFFHVQGNGSGSWVATKIKMRLFRIKALRGMPEAGTRRSMRGHFHPRG
jgi:hypothetical protein